MKEEKISNLCTKRFQQLADFLLNNLKVMLLKLQNMIKILKSI